MEDLSKEVIKECHRIEKDGVMVFFGLFEFRTLGKEDNRGNSTFKVH